MNRNLDYVALENSQPVQNSRLRGILLLAAYLMVFFASLTIVPIVWGETVGAYTFLGLIIGTFISAKIREHKKKAVARSVSVSEDKMIRFALANYARLIRDKVPSNNGRIFTVGYDRKIIEALRFDDGLEIGNYQFSEYIDTPWSKSARVQWGYVKIPLKRNLPHIYMDARTNKLGLSYTLSSRVDVYFPFDQDQKIRLEGDFNRYFTLYVPKGYERDALYIFTPDVMADLIDHGKKYDVEIVDNELYFYSETAFSLDSPDFYKQELPIFDVIKNEIIKQADGYADDRVFDARKLNVVAEQGSTLGSSSQIKSGLVIGGILTLLCTLITVIFILLLK